jgi:hypothetical protein
MDDYTTYHLLTVAQMFYGIDKMKAETKVRKNEAETFHRFHRDE